MSDRLTIEDMERLKARDVRVRDLDLALQIEGDLRGNVLIKQLIASLQVDADRAFEEIADAHPDEFKALQAKVYRLVFVRRTIDAILQRGAVAAASLESDDQVSSAAGEFD